MAVGRIRVGYRQVSGFAVLNLGMISHLKFLGWGSGIYQIRFWIWFLFVDTQWITIFNKNSYFIVYLIIIYLFELSNLLYVDLENYFLFIASYLYIYTCECNIYHVYVYRKYLLLLLYCHTNWVLGIREFDFWGRFLPESVFGIDSGFKFGFRFWVRRQSTWSELDLLPSLLLLMQTTEPSLLR